MRSSSWSWLGLLREAWLNTFGWRARGTAILAIAVIMATGQAHYVTARWDVFQQSLTTQEDQGRNTIVFSSADSRIPAKISKASCDQLALTPGILSVGTMVDLGRSSFSQLGTSVGVVGVSESLIPELEDHSAVVGSALGLGRGAVTLEGDNYGALSAVVGSPQESRLGLGSMVAIPLDPTVIDVDSCTVLLARYSPASLFVPLLQSELSRSGGQVIGSERLRNAYPLVEDYLNRLDRYLPLLLGGIGAAIAAIQYRMRSGEIAAYRLSGTSPVNLAKLFFIEQAICSGTLATSGVTAVYLLQSRLDFPVASAFSILLSAVTWMAAFSIASCFIVFRNPVRMAKDR